MLIEVQNWLDKPNNIYEVVNPLQSICHFLGLNPYKLVNKNGSTRYHSTFWTKTRCVVLFVLYLALIIIHILCKGTFMGNNVEDYLITLEEHFISLLDLVSVMFGYLFAQSVMDAFRNLNEVDQEFKKMAIWMPYRRTHAVVVINVAIIIFIGVILIIWILLVHPLENITVTTVSEIATFLPLLLLTYFMESQYVQYVKLIHYRYCILNEHLHVLHRENNTAEGGALEGNGISKVSSNGLKSCNVMFNPILVIEKVMALHIKLTDTIYLINRAFSVQLLFRITMAFVTIVTALYSIGVNLSNQNSSALKIDMLFTMWALSSVVELLIIVHSTNSACEEANKCPRLMHKIRNSTKNAKLQDMIEMYSVQLYHNRVKCYVCGLFPLDYTLLHTIVAGVTTYLVILVQFNAAGNVTKKSKKSVSENVINVSE